MGGGDGECGSGSVGRMGGGDGERGSGPVKPAALTVAKRIGGQSEIRSGVRLEIKIGEHLTFGSDRGVPEGREARGHGGGGGQYPVG